MSIKILIWKIEWMVQTVNAPKVFHIMDETTTEYTDVFNLAYEYIRACQEW